MAGDPSEHRYGSDQHPLFVRQLGATYEQWEETLLPVDYSFTREPQIPMPQGSGWAYADQPETH